MPDIDQQIASWRRNLAKTIHSDEILDELESHVRDDIQKHIDTGTPPEQALADAMARLGNIEELAQEFGKTTLFGARSWLPVRLILLLTIVMLFFVLAALGAKLHFGNIARPDWLLAGHVLAITMGYLTTFLAGLLGLCYLINRLFRSLTYAQSYSLRKAHMLLTGLASGLVLAGTILGMIWAWDAVHLSWLDARAIEAWLVFLCLGASVLCQRNGWLAERFLMQLSVITNTVMISVWFGGNAIVRGLHSYGVATGLGLVVAAFALANVLLAATAFVPDRRQST